MCRTVSFLGSEGDDMVGGRCGLHEDEGGREGPSV